MFIGEKKLHFAFIKKKIQIGLYIFHFDQRNTNKNYKYKLNKILTKYKC